MPETLKSSDLDTLRDAVSAGDVPAEPASQAQIFSRFRRDLDNIEIRDYDFKQPDRIGREHLRALMTLHETFARNLGGALSGQLRTIVEVRVATPEPKTYAEFIGALPNPTCFAVVKCPPLDGLMCLDLRPLMAYTIIDRLLGGSSQDLFIPQRAMTQIERRLIHRLLERGMACLTEAWQSVRRIGFTLGEMESNPQIAQIVPPNEVVVVIDFEIRLANRAGMMSLCIPFNVIEPLIETLSSQDWPVVGRRCERQWQPVIAQRLSDAMLDVSGILAETSMTIADLRNLEEGDVILTEKQASAPVTLLAGGRPKFLAEIGQHKGRRALKIVRPLRPGERV